MKKWHTITIRKSTLQKLKKLKLIKTESLGSVIERLIAEHEEAELRKEK
jgi:predicted CopG family antitoxin